MKYLYTKAVDWVFRKKTILYFLVMALFREFTAIGASDILNEWKLDPSLQDWFIHYPVMALNFFFAGGNWTVIWILVGLIVLFKIIETIEGYFNSKKDKKTSEGIKVVNKDKVKKQVIIKGQVEEINL